MALTSAIKVMLFTLVTIGLTWIVEALGLTEQIDVKVVAEVVANALSVLGAGLVAYLVNKAGSRWSWVNFLFSLGRAKSPAAYVPKGAEAVTVTTTPPGAPTGVVATNAEGVTTEIKI